LNTTLLFAELLIIGLQVGIWFFFLILSIFGVTWIQAAQLAGLSDWQTIIAAVLFSLLYALGIVLDRLADFIFSGWEKRLMRQTFPNSPISIAVMRFELGKENDALNRQFDYNRSRMRIVRASALNFGLTTLFVVTFILTRVSNVAQWTYLIPTVLVGLSLMFLAVYSWRKLMRGYLGLMRDIYVASGAKLKMTKEVSSVPSQSVRSGKSK
jgi:hypothetical protein